MAQLGYRKKEPRPMQNRETSQLLKKTLGQLRSEGVSRARIAEELLISKQEIDRLIFGLVLTGLQGGRSSTAEQIRGGGQLRLVKS